MLPGGKILFILSLKAGVADSDRALQAHDQFLNKFEKAQIMYLKPESVEVAVALIPR
jgi:hypothetical protein